jgi:CHAD domain-containing protein
MTQTSVATGPALSANPGTLREVVQPYLAEQCRVITEAEGPLRAGEPVIHTTRVAVRRLRSTLRTFEALFDVPTAAKMEEELVWYASLLGAVRDLDILADRMATRIDALPAELVLGPVAGTIATEIAVRRKARMAEVVAALDSDRYAELGRFLTGWRGDPPLTESANGPAATIKKFVRRADRRVNRRMQTAIEAYAVGAPEAEELLHRARKAGKRHRYAVELVEPIWGAKATKVVDRRKRLQDVLGDYQDSLVSAAFLRELGAAYGNRSGQNGFTFGLLYADERHTRDDLQDRLRRLVG